MIIISFIEDEQPVKKNPQAPGLMGCQTQTASLRQRPAAGSLIIYDESSSPSVDDYIIDSDRTTLRLSTGYPIETYL
jgi:hypothetical protein